MSKKVYRLWEPELVFSDHRTAQEILESKARTANIVSTFFSIPGWILGMVPGVPPILQEGVTFLLQRLSSATNSTSDALLEAKIDKAQATSATSLLNSKLKAIESRLSRLFQNIDRREKEHEVVPALHSCEEILALFEDPNYIFWTKPQVSSPLLLIFVGIYLAVAKMAVTLFPSYDTQVSECMSRLGNTIDAYRRHFLCFRLKQPKYPNSSSKNIVDKYDTKHRKSPQKFFTTPQPPDCVCLHHQKYNKMLAHGYGAIFDSAKAAILETGLLLQEQRIETKWCTTCQRCCWALRPQTQCFCKCRQKIDDDVVMVPNERVEEAVAEGKCLVTLTSPQAPPRDYAYSCQTCEKKGPQAPEGVGLWICRNCMKKCHNGHSVSFACYDWFACTCGSHNLNPDQCKLQPLEEKKVDRSRTTAQSVNDGGGAGPVDRDLLAMLQTLVRIKVGLGCLDEFEDVDTLQNSVPTLSLGNSTSFEAPHNTFVWPNIMCDVCEDEITGSRYKCLVCDDYDLCHDCIRGRHHIAHDFMKMTVPLDRGFPGQICRQMVHRCVECDGCDEKPLCGKRYKCLVCKNYDLCWQCRKNGVHEEHPFRKI